MGAQQVKTLWIEKWSQIGAGSTSRPSSDVREGNVLVDIAPAASTIMPQYSKGRQFSCFGRGEYRFHGSWCALSGSSRGKGTWGRSLTREKGRRFSSRLSLKCQERAQYGNSPHFTVRSQHMSNFRGADSSNNGCKGTWKCIPVVDAVFRTIHEAGVYAGRRGKLWCRLKNGIYLEKGRFWSG